MSRNVAKGQRQWVFSFPEGDGTNKQLLGGKGAQLAGMTSLGLPVPPGFTITTEACAQYYASGKTLPDGLWDQVLAAVKDLEETIGRGFGDPSDPLLVSVRSGAAISMPGMMDTVLNLGINEQVAAAIAQSTQKESFALDLHRRFIQMFGNVVLGIDGHLFDEIMVAKQREREVEQGAGLSPADFRDIIARFKAIIRSATGEDISDDPYVQLERAIRAVFESWNSRRAIAYRNSQGIPHDMHTAVNVQAMVFGNRDDDSSTGVLFTRNPSTGEKKLYGEYLRNAQGEDVVAGTSTPHDINYMAEEIPEIYRQLVEVSDLLEGHYRDIQDMEFTVEQGKLYMLQTRDGKRGAKAAVKAAVDMVAEGLITKEEAILRVDPEQIYQLLLPRFDEKTREAATSEGKLLGSGLGASPGAASGKLALTADTAADLGGKRVSVILARPETVAEDVHGIVAAAGVLTSRGGATSHAAVVARGLGKPSVTGAESIEINPEGGYIRCGDVTVKEGAEISIDGTSGEVFIGSLETVRPRFEEEKEMITLLSWADSERRLGVWANADSPLDAEVARGFGAEGIGLCRTEHMFFAPERLSVVQDMILAAHRSLQRPKDQELQEKYHNALAELELLQTADFEGVFRAMDGKTVVIRLLDPPLHEFLPSHERLQSELAELKAKGADAAILAEKEALAATVGELREVNPMLGLRGCRVGLMYPAINEMQARAIIRAAHNVSEEGVIVKPEIMVPLVSHANEMKRVRDGLESTIESLHQEEGISVSYKIGVMIETPRAALTAGEIAESAEFFSFGTNDLTQTAFAFSRDDAEGKFLMRYVDEGILDKNPFQVLDREGIGQLVEMACESGRKSRPDLEIGICGEHGGDPSSVEFFHEAGLDYVSASPYRVPVARLAAAQAALRSGARQ